MTHLTGSQVQVLLAACASIAKGFVQKEVASDGSDVSGPVYLKVVSQVQLDPNNRNNDRFIRSAARRAAHFEYIKQFCNQPKQYDRMSELFDRRSKSTDSQIEGRSRRKPTEYRFGCIEDLGGEAIDDDGDLLGEISRHESVRQVKSWQERRTETEKDLLGSLTDGLTADQIAESEGASPRSIRRWRQELLVQARLDLAELYA